MIKLNLDTGDLEIFELVITPLVNTSDVESLNSKFDLEIYKKNDQVSMYIIYNLGKGHISIFILFRRHRLSSIEIRLGDKFKFPPYVITNQEREELDAIFKSIGGEKKYKWGSVELSEDTKGGVLSILIKYN
jgi:hypothetical protein